MSIKSGSSLVKVGQVPYIGRSAFLVPCGKCLACKSRRKSEMVFRMDNERRLGHLCKDGSVRRYKHCFFITLTYAERFLPRFVPTSLDFRTGEVLSSVEVPDNHPGLLNPLHLSECLKRLRRYYSLDCKMFKCGEYGDDGSRPHYHLIFYSDLDWNQTKDAFRRAWSMKCPDDLKGTPGSFVVKDGKYKTTRFSFGRIHVKPVNLRRMRYCAKYVIKDTDSKQPVPKFGRCSHFLGSAWLLTGEARSTRQNKRLFAYTSDGQRSSIGRYFTHRIFTKDELNSCVDSYLREFETPPEGFEFGEAYRLWWHEHIASRNALYRSNLAKSLIPNLCYV